MLSDTEKKYLEGGYKPTSDRVEDTLQTRIRKKATSELQDLFLICRNKDKVVPKKEKAKNWADVKKFCDTASL